MTKSTRPMVRIHNSETNEFIDQEMNDTEYAQYQLDAANAETRKAAEEAKAAKRAELLSRLGITEEEARILLG